MSTSNSTCNITPGETDRSTLRKSNILSEVYSKTSLTKRDNLSIKKEILAMKKHRRKKPVSKNDSLKKPKPRINRKVRNTTYTSKINECV